MNKGLTSFRALAFFSIFLLHLKSVGSGHLGIDAGYLGVLAFFVLSGFLLTPIIVDMKSNLSRKDFFIHFYGRRALRIFPLYFSYIIIVTFVYFLAASRYGQSQPTYNGMLLIIELDKFIKQLPYTITYTYDFYAASIYAELSYFATHFWSLAVEEQFYLVWPLAIYYFPSNQLKKFLLVVILAAPLIRCLLAIIIDTHMLPLWGNIHMGIWYLPFSHVDAFAIGGYFALYGKSRSGYLVGGVVFLVILLGMITSWLSTGEIHWDQLGYGFRMDDSYKYVWGYSVLNLTFALALVHIRDKALMPAFFENPLLVYLGKISYGLYVYHFPVLWLIYLHMRDYSEIARSLTALLVTIIISMFSYEYVERRFINSKDKYFARVSASK